MDRSDLDSFQNITNPNEKKSARNSFGTNQQSNANIPSNSSQNQQNNQAYYHHQQQQLHQQPQHQVCQICGVFLKIDSNILNMSEPTYKQLAMQFNYRDDFETTLCSGAGAMGDNFSGSGLGGVMGATSLDTDMELSLNANLISSGTSQTGGGGALTATGGSSQEKSTTALEEQPLYRKSITPYMFDAGLVVESTTTGGAQSTLLMTGQHDMLTGWSARINETTALFDMMSSNTAIDHPLCEECADLLVNQLDAQCKIVENEYTEYMQLIGRLNAQVNSESEIAELEKELDGLEVEERELLNKIQDAEKEKEKQEKEKEERLAEEVSLLQQEQTYLLEYSNFKRQLIKLEEKQESLDNQLQNTKFHFNRLRTVNVLNAAFHIWHSGPFGTINFFRLGRLPGIQVEWDEINAGLGQANLLLYCLANRMGLEFKRYRLVPNGSYSSIEVVESASGHDTKSGDELNMYRIKGYKYYFDWDKKFEKGMTAFLDCLKQLEEKITSQDNEFSLPYKINQHKLEDKNGSSYSIKFQLNSFEEWTKALKYMLTNLKWSLAWVISNENS